MTSRELTARQRKNSHDKGERGIRSHDKITTKKVDSCFMTGFGVVFSNGKEERKGRKEQRSKKKVSTLVSLSKLQQQQQHLKLTPQQPHGNSN